MHRKEAFAKWSAGHSSQQKSSDRVDCNSEIVGWQCTINQLPFNPHVFHLFEGVRRELRWPASLRLSTRSSGGESVQTRPLPTGTFHLLDFHYQSLSTPCTWVTLILCKTLSLPSYTTPRLRNCRNHEQVVGFGKSPSGMLRHTSAILNPPSPALLLPRELP